MRISVLGLGYVGAVVAGCLARRGHQVVGVDTDPAKVALLNTGRAPIIEPEIGEITAREVAAGRLSATVDVAAAVPRSDLIMICVGTPSRGNGGIDLSHVQRVCRQIGAALPAHAGAPVIVVRSTLLPGTARDLVIPTLEASSGRQAGTDFGVCVNPEFLREGSAVHDYLNPPKTVIGELNRASGNLLASLYTEIAAPLIRTDIETAEMVKYADNAWHALKVGFANEIGHFCKSLGVDSHRVMDIFCRDSKLNLSACYLKPGFAFGGSCLPKDLKALLHRARSLDVSLPILSAVLPSNELQIERAVQTVIEHGSRKVGILGLSFKAGSDDLREQPGGRAGRAAARQGLRAAHLRRQREPREHPRHQPRLHHAPHSAHLGAAHFQHRGGAGARRHPRDRQCGARSSALSCRGSDSDQTVIDLVRIGECHSVDGRLRRRRAGEACPHPRREPARARSTGASGRRRARCAAPATRSRSSAPPDPGCERRFEIIDGMHIYRYRLPLEAANAGGYLVEYLAALAQTFILAWRVLLTRGFDVVHACNPPDLLFLVGGFFKLLGKKFLFDHHDLNPELYEAKFGRRDFFYRLLLALERATFRAADVSIATNDSYREIAIDAGPSCRPSGSSWCAAGRASSACSGCRPMRA